MFSSQLLAFSLMFCLFFFNDPATTEIYTLSLHDALPISWRRGRPPAWRAGEAHWQAGPAEHPRGEEPGDRRPDRKSTRLNSSHVEISYAVFCLKKKKKKQHAQQTSR